MHMKHIPLADYPRRAHFTYFKTFAYPYTGVTVNVDITDFMERRQETGAPFFLSFLHCVAQAANSVSALRQRILNGEIVEFDHCPTSHTVALADGTFCYCRLDGNMPLEVFLPYAAREQERARCAPSIEDGDEALALLFVSSVPWFTYTAIQLPSPTCQESNPRLQWGKYFQQDGRTLIPVSLFANHALVDGVHFAQFYEALAALV